MSYQFIIENDHKIIHSLVKELCSSARLNRTPRECEGIFSSIIEALQDHFATEEQAMSMHGYPAAKTHRDAHLKLLELFHKIGEDLITSEGKLYLGKLEHGESELSEHITSHDLELTHFLRDKKAE